MDKRSGAIDLIKGIAIFLVVLGHAIQYSNGTDYFEKGLYYSNFIFKTIYSFHMPLFMIISGYLFWGMLSRRRAKDAVLRRIRQLFIPLVVWSLLDVVLKLVQLKQLGNIFKFYINCFIYNLWFLWAVLWATIVVVIVHKLMNDRLEAYIFICVLILFVPDWFNAHLYKFMLPFYIVGYLYAKQEDNKIEKANRNMWIVAIVIFLILLIAYKDNYYVYLSGQSLWTQKKVYSMFVISYRFIIGLLGSFIVIKLGVFLSEKFVNNKLILLFESIGKRSMGIYIVSNYIVSYTNFSKVVTTFSAFRTLIFAVLILLIAWYLTVLLNKNRILSFLFLGTK